MEGNQKVTPMQADALHNKFYVSKGINEWYMEERIKIYTKGTTTPDPRWPERNNRTYPTQDMLDRIVQGVYNDSQQFQVALHPVITEEQYIDD